MISGEVAVTFWSMPKPSKGYQVRLTPEQKEDIRLLYWGGKSHQDIIAKYECSESNFWNIVRGMRKDVLAYRFDVQVESLGAIPEAKLGWVAGIVDGEGYIGIVRSRNKREGSFTLMPRVDIISTTRIMQEELARVLGFGCVYERTKHQDRRPREKTQYAWGIWSAAVVGPFLTALSPYLVVKKQQAQVVQAFCESRLEHDMEPYTKADLAALTEIRHLNRRGRVDRDRGSVVVPT